MSSFEEMLADPNEQFDRRGELLKSITEYANAEPCAASADPFTPTPPTPAEQAQKTADARLITAAADPMSDELQTTISGLARRQAKAVDEKLRALLAARGIDPDDRSDGWEDRAREALADLEIVDSVDMSDPYRMTVTTEIRPKRDIVGEEER